MHPPTQHGITGTGAQQGRNFAEYELQSLPEVAVDPGPEIMNGAHQKDLHAVGDTANCSPESITLPAKPWGNFWSSPKKRAMLIGVLSVVVVSAVALGTALGTSGNSSQKEPSPSENTTQELSSTKLSPSASASVSTKSAPRHTGTPTNMTIAAFNRSRMHRYQDSKKRWLDWNH
jgi:hypothetical protein